MQIYGLKNDFFLNFVTKIIKNGTYVAVHATLKSPIGLLFDSCVLFDSLCRDGCRHFRGVIHLRVGRGRTDSPPCLTTCKNRGAYSNQEHNQNLSHCLTF